MHTVATSVNIPIYKFHLGHTCTHSHTLKFFHSVRLHMNLSLAAVKAWLGQLIGLLSLSQYTSAEGESIYCQTSPAMPRSAGCYWTFFWLAKQATNKLASSWWNSCRTMKTWTALQRCTLYAYALLLVQISCTPPPCLRDFCFHTGFLLRI